MSNTQNTDASFFKEVSPNPGPMTIGGQAKNSQPKQHVDASFFDHDTHKKTGGDHGSQIKKESKASQDQKQSHSSSGAHDGFPVMDKPKDKQFQVKDTDLQSDLHKNQITDLTHAAMVKEGLKDDGNIESASQVEKGLLEKKKVKDTELKNDIHEHQITDLTHAKMVKEGLNEEGQYKKAKKIDEGLKEKKQVKDTELKNDLHQHEITDLTHAQMVKEGLNEEGKYNSAKKIDKDLKESPRDKGEKHKVDARFEESHAHIENITKVPGGNVDTKLQQLEQKLGNASSEHSKVGSQEKSENKEKPKADAKYEENLTETIPRVVDSRLQKLEEKLGHQESKDKADKGPKDELLKEASKDKSLKASRDPSYETSERDNEKAEKKKAKEADSRYEQHKKEANNPNAPITDRIYAGAQMVGDSIEGAGHRVAGVYYQQGASSSEKLQQPDAGKLKEGGKPSGDIEKKAHQALDAVFDTKQQATIPSEVVGHRESQDLNQKVFTTELSEKPLENAKSADIAQKVEDIKPKEGEIKKAQQDPDQPLSDRSREGEVDGKSWAMEEKLKAQQADERYEQHKNQLVDPDQPLLSRLSAGFQLVGDTIDGALHRVQETVAHSAGTSK